MNYEENKAAYWRNCEAWTFSEVQCLLDGQWPDSIDEPPSSLSATLIQTGEQIGADGMCEVVGYAIDRLPHVHSLKRTILDAIAAGALTPMTIPSISGVKLHGSDGEPRFRPAEVIAWASSRESFPDFPFSLESLPTPAREATRAVSRAASQDAAVLQALADAGFDPKNLPKVQPGKRGPKAIVRARLGKTGMWAAETVFGKTWDRLRANGDIADS